MNEDLLNVMGRFSEVSLDCIEKQNEEIEQLQQRITRAIEYIKTNYVYDEDKNEFYNADYFQDDLFDLLEILKGDNKED